MYFVQSAIMTYFGIELDVIIMANNYESAHLPQLKGDCQCSTDGYILEVPWG